MKIEASRKITAALSVWKKISGVGQERREYLIEIEIIILSQFKMQR